MSTPTTRRYPRSLSEAYPDIRASSIERHRRAPRWLEDAAGVLLAVAIGAFFGILLAVHLAN